MNDETFLSDLKKLTDSLLLKNSRQVCLFFGLSEATVASWKRRGRIPYKFHNLAQTENNKRISIAKRIATIDVIGMKPTTSTPEAFLSHLRENAHNRIGLLVQYGYVYLKADEYGIDISESDRLKINLIPSSVADVALELGIKPDTIYSGKNRGTEASAFYDYIRLGLKIEKLLFLP